MDSGGQARDPVNPRVRVAVVDDHPMVAEALIAAVGPDARLESVAVLGTGEEFLRALVSGLQTDVVVLDLTMPGMGGAQTLRILGKQAPDIKVLVVSGAGRAEIAARCLTEGARGFLCKAHPAKEFVSAILTVADGRRYVDPDLVEEVVGLLADSPVDAPHLRLTPRELEVMTMVARGRSNKAMARDLHLSPKTVSTYRARVLEKMGLVSNAELTAYALHHRLVEFEVP